MAEQRFVFIAEWFDIQSNVLKTFNFTFYPSDNSIQLVDLKNSKLFLKKCKYPEISLRDLYIGSVVIIYARQLKITDYADVSTKQYFENKKEKTYAMIKPDAYMHIGKVFMEIEKNDFKISNVRMTKMTKKDAEEFYGEHVGKPFFEGLVTQMSSDVIVGIELCSENAVSKWRDVIGPTNPDVAREKAPKSLRALYGQQGPKNVVHGSDSHKSAERELKFVFSDDSSLKTTTRFNNCTLCLIKPHIFESKQVGQVLDMILKAGFEISAMQLFYLDLPTSEEFFSVYKGVLPEYSLLAEHLITGPCLALEIRQENAVNKFREFCGPHDPQIAKTLRPDSLRAKFGLNRVKNAIHCTDLPEDGPLEVQYFFKILMVDAWK